MASRPARGSISRTTLIWTVVAAFLIVSGVAVYFAVRKSAGPATPQGSPITLQKPAEPPPMPDPEAPFQSDNGRAQFVDRSDPSRVAGEMLYRRLDPLPRGRFALEEPQLWYFLKDGRTLHLRSAKGNVKFFQGTQKPESGRFDGGVVARVYAKGVASVGTRPDPAATAPELLYYTDYIVFDLSLGEFSNEGVVNSVSSTDWTLQGTGLTVLFNEVRGSVASIELGGVGFLHARSGKSGGAAKAPSVAVAPAPPTPGGEAPPATTPPAPKIDLYTTEIAGPVLLTVGTERPQTVNADKLWIWSRLVDGKLPAGAIADLGTKNRPSGAAKAPTGSTPTPVVAVPEGASQPAPAATVPSANGGAVPSIRERLRKLRMPGGGGAGGVEPLTPISDDDALLTWGGRLRAVAVEAPPAELATEQVAARFVSESEEPVKLTDAGSGATILSNAAHYGATTAAAELIPRDDGRITIADARGGHAEFPGLRLNLKTGIGQSRGAGFLTRRDLTKKTPTGEPAQDRLNWSEQADFVFETGSASGSGLQFLRQAAFTGDVKGVSNEAEITGSYLRADFAPPPADVKGGEALLSRVVVDGNAVGRTLSATEPQTLAAASFDLSFSPTEDRKRSFPSLLVAKGGVRGEQTELVADEKEPSKKSARTAKLSSDSLEATLARDAKGNTVVTDAVARGAASFQRSDGVQAQGEEIRTAVVDKTAVISGPTGRVAARDAVLEGSDLQLDGTKNSVLVRTGGRLEHRDAKAKKLEEGQRAALSEDVIGLTTLTWDRAMYFDDSTGEGEALGGVTAVTHPDPFTQNTVKGERMVIRTARATGGASDGPPNKEGSADNLLGDVVLRSAEAIAAEGGASASRATAEQRVYVADAAAPSGRRLEKLTYIEGPRLSADEENGVFRVPGAGRALVMDQSAAPVDGPERKSDGPFGNVGGSRGTTLMEWGGELTMNNREERADANGGVRITHKPVDAGAKPVVLTAEGVEAKFRLARRASGERREGKDQLISTTARGTVRIVTDNGDREITADQATYDAQNEIVEASATEPHSGVTFLDKTKGVPTIARRLRWNIRTDEISILEPMPGSAPIK